MPEQVYTAAEVDAQLRAVHDDLAALDNRVTALEESGGVDPEPPPVNGVTPEYEVTITPPGESGTGYNWQWLYAKGANTPWRSPDSYRHVQRYMLLDPRATDADGRPGQDEWWIVLEALWPSAYQPNVHGQWGRQSNFHNVAGDSGPAGSGGVGWGFGAGSSALALDWLPSNATPSISLLSTYSGEGKGNAALPAPERDKWQRYDLHWIAGRNDGTTVRPGFAEVFVNGATTPHFRFENFCTVQKARAADGNYYVQKWMQLWEGDYTRNLQAPATHRFRMARLGKTREQAEAERPTPTGTAGSPGSSMTPRGTAAKLQSVKAQEWPGPVGDDPTERR